MQFRVQGRKLQCLRSIYNSETKRSEQKLIARIPSYLREIPAADEENNLGELTPDEVKQLEIYLSNAKAASDQTHLSLAVKTAPGWLKQLSDGLATIPVTPDHANSIWAALDAVSKAMRKAGYKKPAPVPKAKKAPAKTAK